VHGNRGVESRYKKRLTALVADMARSVEYWLTAAMRTNPSPFAADARPIKEIQKALNELADRWIKRFDEMAPKLAEAYMSSMFKATDVAFKSALRDAGWSVRFDMTPGMRDALNATIEQNIGLIKSIPQQYLTDVQGIVMRGFTAGRDLEEITKQLQQRHGVTKRRAELIARDQSNKASSVCNKARSLELGITQGVWLHSHGGKEPRPDHLAANGKVFDLAKGMKLDDGWVQPGELINCRCSYRAVLPI